MAAATKCDNCGKMIGKLEEKHVWQEEHVVCGPCITKLSSVQEVGVTRVPPAPPAEQVRTVYVQQGPPQDQKRVQLIEKTGKEWKAAQAAGCLAVFAGLVLICVGGSMASQPGVKPDAAAGGTAALGILVILAGFAVLVVARIGAWWNHG